MNTDEQDRIAHQAADRAVEKTFAILGVDIKNPREIEDFRKDLRLANYMRRWLEKGIMATAGVIVVAACAALVIGIQTKLGMAK